ncbi:NAD(+) diphosphatase [Nitrincola tapanii]|uniref:NAD(+) diphosphatase n=1 Tax=Nitrincola tapanii TaxID=1708751 RepID=A0A5A9W495_9GAMM|nr:NAD(+) diphosphatase [Nitrincola tapanii]KAA0875304.1 NAD(+) diphosphatase [Nitrincola tapanii]
MPNITEQSLRQALSQADEQEYLRLSRESQLQRWHERHRFCALCSGTLQPHNEDEALACRVCGHLHYPPVSPCVLVLVAHQGRCLLAHAAKFSGRRFSALAGFIEPGESAEQAVKREVMEEVGIQVKNIRYFASQSWPFPHALMLGFFAEYESGEIEPDGIEILEADWFTPDALPEDLPPEFTLSRQLIQAFVQGHTPGA